MVVIAVEGRKKEEGKEKKKKGKKKKEECITRRRAVRTCHRQYQNLYTLTDKNKSSEV